MADTSALNICAVALADRLSAALIEGVPDDDPTQAGVVKTGKLQANPLKGKVNILVTFGGEDWKNSLFTGMPGGAVVSPYEIGGKGATWEWERLIVRFELHFKGMLQPEAMAAGAVVYSRAKHAIRTMAMPGGDTFGETPKAVYVHGGHLTHEGGPAKTFIFRGELRVEFLTVTEPSD